MLETCVCEHGPTPLFSAAALLVSSGSVARALDPDNLRHVWRERQPAVHSAVADNVVEVHSSHVQAAARSGILANDSATFADSISTGPSRAPVAGVLFFLNRTGVPPVTFPACIPSAVARARCVSDLTLTHSGAGPLPSHPRGRLALNRKTQTHDNQGGTTR